MRSKACKSTKCEPVSLSGYPCWGKERDYLEHHHRIPSYDHHPNPHLLSTRLLLYRFVEDDVQEDLNQRKDVNDRAPNTPD